MTETHYDVLELSVDATAAEIKSAHRRLVMTYHPDRNPGFLPQANERVQRLQEAYDVLSDPVARRAYDTTLGIGRGPPRVTAERDRIGRDLERELLDLARRKLTGSRVASYLGFLERNAGPIAAEVQNGILPHEQFVTMAVFSYRDRASGKRETNLFVPTTLQRAWRIGSNQVRRFTYFPPLEVSGQPRLRSATLVVGFHDESMQIRVLPKERLPELLAWFRESPRTAQPQSR
jgi:curved DNA-binding protein CbpA